LKRLLKFLALAAITCVICSIPAFADYNVQDKGTYKMNANSGAVVDASGNAKVVDADRDRDYWTTANLINNQLTASGTTMADSNVTPIATYGYRRSGLMIYPQFDSLSTVVRIAVQVRAHYNSSADSANAFPWYRWPTRSTSAASDVDSIGHFTNSSQATPVQVTSGSGLYSGEFLVKFDVARQDLAGGGAGKPWAYPKGIYVPLNDATGAPYWAPYTSVRVRVLNGVRSRMRVRVDYVGSAQ